MPSSPAALAGLAASGLAFLPPAAHAAPSSPIESRLPTDDDAETYHRAQADARPALTFVHLLATSSQSLLKRLQWSFGRWGLKAQRELARSRFERLSDRNARLREEAEAVQAASDPLAPFLSQGEASAASQAATGLPASEALQIEEIRRLRADYDADAGRSALARAAAGLKSLEYRLGTPSLTPAQGRILELSSGTVRAILAAREELRLALPPAGENEPGSARASRSLVEKDLAALGEDAEALGTETARLKLHFLLNNLLNRRDAPRPGTSDQP